MLSYSRLLQPVTYTKKYTLLWPFSMVKGYKNKNKEREREHKQLLSECAGRSQEWWREAKWERLAERCRQRDAGRETHAEMQAEPDIALAGAWAATRKWSLQQWQRQSRGRAKACDQVVLVALPLIQHFKVSRSRSFSLLLSDARVRPVSVCLAAVKPHAPKPMTKLCVWFIFVAFCVQVLFVFFIIYHYFLPASSFTDLHTHTGTQTGLPCYAASCLGYTAQNQAQIFKFAFAHALDAEFISYYK